MAAAATISNHNKSLSLLEEALGNDDNNEKERFSLLNLLLSKWCEYETSRNLSEKEKTKKNSLTASTITTAMIFRQMILLEERLVKQENTIEGLQKTVQRQQNCIEKDLASILKTLKSGNNNGMTTALVSDHDDISNSESKHNKKALREMMLHPSSVFTSVRTIDLEPTEPVNYNLQDEDNDEDVYESTSRTDDAVHQDVGNNNDDDVDQDLLSKVFDYIPSMHTKSSKESKPDDNRHHKNSSNNDASNDVDQKLLSKVFSNTQDESANKSSSMISKNASELDSLKGKTIERIMEKKTRKRLSSSSSKNNAQQEIQFNASDLNEGGGNVYRPIHSLTKTNSIFIGEQIDEGMSPALKNCNKETPPAKPTRTKSLESKNSKNNSNKNVTGLGGVGGAMILPQFKRNSRRSYKNKKTRATGNMSIAGSESMVSVREDDVMNQQELDYDINQSNSSMPALSLCRTRSAKTLRSQVGQSIPEEGEMSINPETVYTHTPSVAFRREIMAKANAVQEVSSLTLDPEIEALQNDHKTIMKVTNTRIQDRYGEEGTYSGTINTDERLPEGFGKMEYDNLRFYEGDWKIGRWYVS